MVMTTLGGHRLDHDERVHLHTPWQVRGVCRRRVQSILSDPSDEISEVQRDTKTMLAVPRRQWIKHVGRARRPFQWHWQQGWVPGAWERSHLQLRCIARRSSSTGRAMRFGEGVKSRPTVSMAESSYRTAWLPDNQCGGEGTTCSTVYPATEIPSTDGERKEWAVEDEMYGPHM